MPRVNSIKISWAKSTTSFRRTGPICKSRSPRLFSICTQRDRWWTSSNWRTSQPFCCTSKAKSSHLEVKSGFNLSRGCDWLKRFSFSAATDTISLSSVAEWVMRLISPHYLKIEDERQFLYLTSFLSRTVVAYYPDLETQTARVNTSQSIIFQKTSQCS